MKNHSLKGFTLVEIMIVVVIIGILATLAIPAVRRARNNAIEKSLFNDARIISATVGHYCFERGVSSVPLSALIGSSNDLNGLSSGTLIAQGPGSVTSKELNSVTNLWSSPGGLSTHLATSLDANPDNAVFRIGNAGYDTALSNNPLITDPLLGGYNPDPAASSKDIGLVFSVETGVLLKKNAKTPSESAAYSF